MGEDKDKKGPDNRQEIVYTKIWGVFGFTKSKKNEKALAAIDENTQGAMTSFLNDVKVRIWLLVTVCGLAARKEGGGGPWW